MKKNMDKDDLLLTPGPVLLSPFVRTSLSSPMWHHRSFKFEEVLREVSSDLKEIFQTNQPVLILNSTGTGAMEAAFIKHLISWRGSPLCLRRKVWRKVERDSSGFPTQNPFYKCSSWGGCPSRGPFKKV